MRNLLPITEEKAIKVTRSLIGWFHTDPELHQEQIRDAEFVLSVLLEYQKELHEVDIVRAQLRIDNDMLNKKLSELKKIIND